MENKLTNKANELYNPKFNAQFASKELLIILDSSHAVQGCLIILRERKIIT